VICKFIQDVPNSHWQLIYNSSQLFILLGIGGCFSLLNWLLESYKWKTLVDPISQISRVEALSESLKAHAVSIITPNKIGEFGAKASFYKISLRKQILRLTLTGQIYQMIATVLFGALGISVMFSEFSPELQITLAMVLGGMVLAILGLFWLNSRHRWIRQLQAYLKSLAKLSGSSLTQVLIWSVLRYVCFSHQFFVLLWLFQPELNYLEIMPIIFSIYLITSMVPTILILDASLKAGVSLVLLSAYLAPEYILVTSVLMWIFNFGIPAFIGNVLLLKRSRPTWFLNSKV
jgi:uncharacterized membrane protein YbhN (UPF0104 family)